AIRFKARCYAVERLDIDDRNMCALTAIGLVGLRVLGVQLTEIDSVRQHEVQAASVPRATWPLPVRQLGEPHQAEFTIGVKPEQSLNERSLGATFGPELNALVRRLSNSEREDPLFAPGRETNLSHVSQWRRTAFPESLNRRSTRAADRIRDDVATVLG